MRVTVKVEGGEELQRKLRRLKGEVNAALDDAAMAGAEVIRRAANSRAPGPHVEAEIVERTKLGAEVNIGPDEEHWYYRFAETGATAHEEKPLNREALAFLGEGGDKVVTSVDHPGHPADPFLRPAIDGNVDEANRAVGERLRQAIEGVA